MDLISSSAYERKAMGRACRVALGGAEVRFASVEDLLVHKVLAGRPRDLEDARGVLLKHSDLDARYVRRWLGAFAAELDSPFVAVFDRLLDASAADE